MRASEAKMKYAKYHALGNDYIVIRPVAIEHELAREVIGLICHRNYGVGSDGILLGPLDSHSCDFGLRIFNPDGSEAEKSGNGLRIQFRNGFFATMTGPVTRICAGVMTKEMFQTIF
jgi:diaminopimelate epimerase